jgi:hypothetical protein
LGLPSAPDLEALRRSEMPVLQNIKTSFTEKFKSAVSTIKTSAFKSF